MRRRGQAHWFAGTAMTLILLVIGTIVGRDLHLGPLSTPIGFSPIVLNLFVASVSVGIATNASGLVGAVVGLLLTRAL